MPNPGSVYINSTIGKWRVFSALERDTGIIEKTNSTSTYGLRWESNYGYWIMENIFCDVYLYRRESRWAVYVVLASVCVPECFRRGFWIGQKRMFEFLYVPGHIRYWVGGFFRDLRPWWWG